MMAAIPETRSVTASGNFDNLAQFLSFDGPSDLVHPKMTYEHRLYHPRRHPAEHVYHTSCRHRFRLQRRTTKTVAAESSMIQASSDEGQETVVDELVIHLSDSVQEMYAEWGMYWEFRIPVSDTDDHHDPYVTYGHKESGFISEHFVSSRSNPVEWKTITVGNVMDIQKLLAGNHTVEDALEFTVKWSRQEPSLSELDHTQRELANLKRLMARTHCTLLTTFRQPSIDTTRLVFRSKRSGTLKYLYVPSHILTQFEYFQPFYPGHSLEYSETQHVDKAKRKRDEVEKPSEGPYGDDSDDEWDSDSEDVEPEKNITFKATIHVTGTSEGHQFQDRVKLRTVLQLANVLFYIIIRALYFAPLQYEYQQYRNNLRSSAIGRLPKEHCIPWPEWAEENCYPQRVVPGFKTLTSSKSMYRLADMLIIPQLKHLCYQHIIDSLQPDTVLSELKSPVFMHHEELRVAAYKFMRGNWHCFDSSEIAPFILVSQHTYC
ncbi:uncharacterized protein MELLADRAFT_90894 [Melampsora larici-populina 98AG31]|uniref:Uncharacterized protein n=1 Tax=Melampsora larici-populina (strain 98AG31 / pathotype 3-4-7) TaxID=747676 RepID=F4R7X8_MELLP|nr:uncharacterized protein MELLADRAFT_90894 [Melampsora larici-populina 98AG31]EGG11397.1 hypothetical protein MELLADRAFT_90894 [Melampsora larici-populina 98AG31]